MREWNLPAFNVSNAEFTYFLLLPWRWLWSTSCISHFPTEIVNIFYLRCLGLESSSNIILQHVFPPTSLNLHVGSLQGQLSRLQTQLSFRLRGCLIRPLNGVQCVHNMQPRHRHFCFVPMWKMGKYLPCGEQFWIQIMRAVWEAVYGIHSPRAPTSLQPGLWPRKPLIKQNYRGWEPLKMIVQRKAGFCLCQLQTSSFSEDDITGKIKQECCWTGQSSGDRFAGMLACGAQWQSSSRPFSWCCRGERLFFSVLLTEVFKEQLIQRLSSARFATENRLTNLQAETVLY